MVRLASLLGWLRISFWCSVRLTRRSMRSYKNGKQAQTPLTSSERPGSSWRVGRHCVCCDMLDFSLLCILLLILEVGPSRADRLLEDSADQLKNASRLFPLPAKDATSLRSSSWSRACFQQPPRGSPTESSLGGKLALRRGSATSSWYSYLAKSSKTRM